MTSSGGSSRRHPDRHLLPETGRGGQEFWQLREYLPGDDYRKINWKVTAHVGKPILNEYRPEKDQNVYLSLIPAGSL